MKVLAVVVQSVAMTAAENIRLPAPNPNPPLTLVERRIVAQNAVVVAKPALRRVAALSAPTTPIALLALNLDVAETAYAPTVRVVNSIMEPALPDIPQVAAHPGHRLAPPARAERVAQRNHSPARLKTARAKTKAKPNVKFVSLRTTTGPSTARRVSGLETPGTLMYRALMNRES